MTNVISFHKKISDFLNQGSAVNQIYLDLSKASDAVPHRKLLATLERLGINEMALLGYARVGEDGAPPHSILTCPVKHGGGGSLLRIQPLTLSPPCSVARGYIVLCPATRVVQRCKKVENPWCIIATNKVFGQWARMTQLQHSVIKDHNHQVLQKPLGSKPYPMVLAKGPYVANPYSITLICNLCAGAKCVLWNLWMVLK